MAVTRAEHIARLKSRFASAWASRLNQVTYHNLAMADFFSGDDHGAIEGLLAASGANLLMMAYLFDKNYPDTGDFSIPAFLDNHTVSAEDIEFDMESILEAMLVADPDEVLKFIGLVDAFRNSVWTRPFNQELYAALSKGFQKWP